MRLGIDASNIRDGGGVTHLVGLLREANPPVYGFSDVVVWSGRSTLSRIEDRPWLNKIHEPLLDGSFLKRLFWQLTILDRKICEEKCDALYVPGSTYAGSFRPYCAFSQNLLPFEWEEIRRYGLCSHSRDYKAVRLQEHRA